VSLGLREADAFKVKGVRDFDRAADEDGDDGAGEISNGSGGAEQEQVKSGKSIEQEHVFSLATRIEARQIDALLMRMRLSRQCIDDASLHSFCG